MPVLSLLTEETLNPSPEIEQKYFPIVFVHGYEVHKDGKLGPLSQAVCEATLSLLQMNGDMRAILLGGWHLKEAGEVTIADAMRNALIVGGIDPQRIITKRRLRSLDRTMEARDSWEEFVLLRQILEKLGVSKAAPFTSVAWDSHINRLTKMHTTYGFTNVAVIPATPKPHKGLCRRKCMEQAARFVQFIDPYGKGIICHGTRLGRTLDKNLEPLIP